MASKRTSRRLKPAKHKSSQSQDNHSRLFSGSLDDEEMIAEPSVTLNLTGSLKADIAAVSKHLSMRYVPDVCLMDQPVYQQSQLPMTSLEKGDRVGIPEQDGRRKTVDMANEDDRMVTTLYITGWKVDLLTWSLLQMVLPRQAHLHTLRLWRAGLNDDAEGFERLIDLLPTCHSLTSLTLDNNRLTYLPLGEVNRTLRALNLTANNVGDEGCQRLAEALSWFPVTGLLQAARRRLIKQEMLRIESERSPTAVPGAESGARGSLPQRKFKKGQLLKLGAIGLDKNQALGVASLMTSSIAVSSAKKPTSRSATPTKASRKQASRQPAEGKATTRLKPAPPESDKNKPLNIVLQEPEWEEPQPLVANPFPEFRPARFSTTDLPVHAWSESSSLLSGGYIRGNMLWLPGNRALVSLNLSRNRVSEKGLAALLAAVEEQHEEREYRLQQRLVQMRQPPPPPPPADFMDVARQASKVTRSVASPEPSSGHNAKHLIPQAPPSPSSSTSSKISMSSKMSVKPVVVEVHQQRNMAQETDAALPDKGLLRIVLTCNLFQPETSTCFARLQERLQARDPLQVLQCHP